MRALVAVGALLACGAVAAAGLAPDEIGERIYREGRLSGAALLQGGRAGSPPLTGQDAACAQCHQRSGLGNIEGRIVIPPIGGRTLFRPGVRVTRDVPIHSGQTHLLPTPPDRPAYDDATLARAIRDGVGANGRPLDYLMPRFDLDEASMGALIDYLKRLSSGPDPGVDDLTLQFATIVTPDADPVARDGMLNVLRAYFDEKNSRFAVDDASPLLIDGRPAGLRTQRRWQLHVWQLSGPPADWEAQLDERLGREPVFAVISGLGGASWDPVHRFCRRRQLPCLLPNVDLPVVEADDFYSVYFSKGVLLEAGLLAARLRRPPGADAGGRIVQVYRGGDIGAAAAALLRKDLSGSTTVVDRELQSADDAPSRAAALAQALADCGSADTLVLWLRGPDLAALPSPQRPAAVYASGLLGGLERAPLASGWRSVARLTYPYALPDERRLALNYPLGWFRLRRIPVVDERVQVQTYVACSVLLEALASMLDEFVRDFLVERVEEIMDSRLVNGYYTRLTLAHDQRFASKGGYLVRFSGPSGAKVAADGGWIVPDGP